MSLEPKHRLISRQLLAEIAAGKYAPSGRLPSEAQLVERFGVSRPTVARASQTATPTNPSARARRTAFICPERH